MKSEALHLEKKQKKKQAQIKQKGVITLSLNGMDLISKSKHTSRHTHAQIRTPPTDGDNKQWLACEKQHRRGVSKQMPVPLLATLISRLP